MRLLLANILLYARAKKCASGGNMQGFSADTGFFPLAGAARFC